MAASERDVTEDWTLSRPVPTIAALEARIDEALVIARAAESAAISIGDVAIESAERAGEAAGLAEKAAAAAAAAAGVTAPSQATPPDSGGLALPAGPSASDRRLAEFLQRADRVGRRLQTLGLGEPA